MSGPAGVTQEGRALYWVEAKTARATIAKKYPPWKLLWVITIVSVVFRTLKLLTSENPMEPTSNTATTDNSIFSRKIAPTEKPSVANAMAAYSIQGPCRSYRSPSVRRKY